MKPEDVVWLFSACLPRNSWVKKCIWLPFPAEFCLFETFKKSIDPTSNRLDFAGPVKAQTPVCVTPKSGLLQQPAPFIPYERTSFWLLTLCAEPSVRLGIEAINLCDSSYLEFFLLFLIRKWQSLSALCMNLWEICNPNHVLLTKWKTKSVKPGLELIQMVMRAWVVNIDIIFVLDWKFLEWKDSSLS